MAGKRSRSGLLSRLAQPLAKAARRVVGRSDTPDKTDEDEVRRLMEMALTEAAHAPARLTEDTFRLFTEQLAREEAGDFQIKLHIISLVEFREAVGSQWYKVADKVMMIAEGVINLHLGAGNLFGRQGSDFFVLIFRTCDNMEGRRRAVAIAQELGTRLVGDQFVGLERPLALAAEVDLDSGLNDDGSLNLGAVHQAVTQIRSLLAGQKPGSAQAPHAWMRGGTDSAPEAPRRHLQPTARAQREPAPAETGPIEMPPEPAPKPRPADPGWKAMEHKRHKEAEATTWVILDMAPAKPLPSELQDDPELGNRPLPADARLSLLWRPTWIAQGEAIAAYEARIQRFDTEGKPALEGVKAYPRADAVAANILDRFRVAGAIRDFRASERAGNHSTVIIPVHWLTLTAADPMSFLAPFADLTPAARQSRVIIDLFGIPAEVKPKGLAAAIETARPLCRMLALRAHLSDAMASLAADCGADMVGIDLAELAAPERTDDGHLASALDDFQAKAAKAKLGTYVWGLRRRKALVGAVRSGFSMVNGPALMKDIPRPAKQLPAPKSRFTHG